MCVAVLVLLAGMAVRFWPAVSHAAGPPLRTVDGTLDILALRGFAEYGGSSSSVNWVSGSAGFQGVTGCRTAHLDFVNTPEELREKLAKRSYDVISAPPELAAELVDGKQVQRIDPAKVTGYAALPKRLRKAGMRGGATYAVPYLWGSYETIYNTARVKHPKAADLFTSSRGIVKNSPLTLGQAALAFGLNPAKLDRAGLDRLAAKLGKGGRRLAVYDHELDLIRALATGKAEYAQATPQLRRELQRAGKPIGVVRTERSVGWVDSWMLGANTPNLDCAYRWLNWTLTKSVQGRAASWLGLSPVNPKACGAAERNCSAYRLDRKIVFLGGVGGGCRPGDRACTQYTAWTKRWHDLVT